VDGHDLFQLFSFSSKDNAFSFLQQNQGCKFFFQFSVYVMNEIFDITADFDCWCIIGEDKTFIKREPPCPSKKNEIILTTYCKYYHWYWSLYRHGQPRNCQCVFVADWDTFERDNWHFYSETSVTSRCNPLVWFCGKAKEMTISTRWLYSIHSIQPYFIIPLAYSSCVQYAYNPWQQIRWAVRDLGSSPSSPYPPPPWVLLLW
jgi:hypothetical protein